MTDDVNQIRKDADEVLRDKRDDGTSTRQDAWNRLRGALKDVFVELGGGENYLRNERASFCSEPRSLML